MQKTYNQSVTSLGNSWVVCRSKSHLGRIYYFNTLTGEAAWNLSEAEIEKATKTTKIIENSGVRIEGCPEPKDPPQDDSSQSFTFKKSASIQDITDLQKTYNGIDNNKSHLIPPLTGVQCTCNHMDPIKHVGLSIPLASGLNPNIWNVPVAPQFVLTSAIPPLVSQTQSTVNMPYKKENELRYVQTTSVPLTKRFGNQSNKTAGYDSEKTLTTDIKKLNTWAHSKSDRNFLYQNRCNFKNDLRELLSTKRYMHSTNLMQENDNDEQGSNLNRSRFVRESARSLTQHADIKVPEDLDNLNIKDEVHTGTKIKFDVTALKNIAKHNIHEEYWYIVPAANVLLNHHGFIKILLDSDEQCHLMVPEHVIAEIRNASRSSNFRITNLACRAMFFLSQNIRAGSATIAKDPLMGNSTEKSYILDCCLKLIEKKIHIVLLSNDKELQNHENAGSIPMFTVNEMKSFLSTSVVDDKTRSREVPRANDCHIKITVPNNQIGENNIGQTKSENITLTSVEDVYANCKTNTRSIGIQVNDVKHEKTIVDVGVQTDFCSEQFAQILNSENNTLSIFATNSEKLGNMHDKIDSVAFPKRKEIKLNRTTSHQSSTNDDNSEKRNYKWRRKRPRCPVESTDVLHVREMNISQNSSDSSSFNKKHKQNEIMENEKLYQQQVDRVSQNIENSGLHASVRNQHPSTDNVIIEETSTSGVISNTVSNNDSECESSVNAQKASALPCPNGETEYSKNVMFEITSQTMEEYLKTRCDEWVSRFIQIMEEVLTQVLQKDPLSYPNSLPPPWTLHEATQCIKMKFIKDCDIVDAANKLCEVLLKISDKKGAINIEMNPKTYMEMYSYGVYLIDTLQAVIHNSEDLQTAAESLAKLLNDIQNPNTDTSHNDSFVDITREAVGDISDVDNTENEGCSAIVNDIESYMHRDEQPNSKHSDSPSKYNLRSQWKRTIQNNIKDTADQFIRNFDAESAFFSSLRLKKNNDDTAKISEPLICGAPLTSDTVEITNNKRNDLIDEPIVNEGTLPETNKQLSEPKIIRNFTKCVDFEEKLMNKEKEMLGLNEIDNSDHPYLNYKYTEDEYISQQECDYYEENEDNDAYEINGESRYNTSPSVDRHYKFKSVISMVLREIREAFLVVYSFLGRNVGYVCGFCLPLIWEKGVIVAIEESQKRMCAPASEMDNAAILLKAKETHSYITNLCNALNSICKRDAETSGCDLTSILKSEEVEGIELDETDLQEYRSLIAKCEDQANVLRETVETIISHTEG